MTTCRYVITRALRKVGLLGKSASPTAADESMGMSALQTLFDGWVGAGKFGRLVDVYRDTAYEAKAGERVRSATSVTLPAYTQVTPETFGDDYGDTDRYDSDQPRARALIVVVDPATGVEQVNLWDPRVGQWIRLDSLTIGGECPLTNMGADDLACCLALLIADESGFQVGALTLRRATLFEARLGTNADSSRQPTNAQFF